MTAADELRWAVARLATIAKRAHYTCDGDTWFNCPMAPEGTANDGKPTKCDCGADKHNEEVGSLVDKIARLIASLDNH